MRTLKYLLGFNKCHGSISSFGIHWIPDLIIDCFGSRLDDYEFVHCKKLIRDISEKHQGNKIYLIIKNEQTNCKVYKTGNACS